MNDTGFSGLNQGCAMSYRGLATLLSAAFLTLTACAKSPETPVRGVVLRQGESVEATNRFGTVRVAYVAPTKREFSWDGQSRVVEMIARPKPFLDELGLYEPASCIPIICRLPRLVVREAVHDFRSDDELYAFIHQGSGVMDWTYTGDGLLVGFGRSPERKQINIDVRQLTIQGRKPSALRGARDRNIRLYRVGA